MDDPLSVVRSWTRLLDEILALGDCLLRQEDGVAERESTRGGNLRPVKDFGLEDSAWWQTWLRRDEAFTRLQAEFNAAGSQNLWEASAAPGLNSPSASALRLAVNELRERVTRVLAQNEALEALLRRRMGAVQRALVHLRQAETFQQTYGRSRPRPTNVLDRRG